MAITNEGLDLQLMREVFAAARTKFKKGFKETQRIRSYKLQKMALSMAETESAEHGFEWSLRIKAAQGSTQKINPFQKVDYQRDTYDTSLKVIPAQITTHTNMVFNNLAERVNKGSTQQLWSDYKMKSSAAEETKAETWESLLLNPGTDGGTNEVLGLLYWYRRSMTSGGVFTAQTTPARNGVYYVDDAAAVSAVMAGKTISAAAYARLRTLVATHGGTLGPVELETIKACILDAGFEYLAKLEGDKTTVDLQILWDDLFDRQYDAICTALGGPRKRDYFDTGETSVKGVGTVAVPSFNGHFLRPIVGWNKAELKFRKQKGGWEVPCEEQINHNSFAFPEDSSGQFWAENPSAAGFMVHGTFVTGT